MKKRIVGLFLALLMMVPFCMTACGPTSDQDALEDITQQSSNSARTLVMYVMTEEETSEEAAKAVSDAISALTESKYKTRLVIKCVPESEYYDVIEGKLAEMQQHADDDTLWYDMDEEEDEEETGEKKEEETVVDEYGVATTKYPETAPYQIDIFYLSGYDKYEEYIANSWLASLNTQMQGTGLLVSDYVSPLLLDGVKYKGQTYAVPNNNPIGQYTYLLINRAVADKYYYSSSLDKFTDVSSLTVKRFLDDLANDDEFNDLVPLNATLDECAALLADYWYINPTTCENESKFSIIGHVIKDNTKMSRGETFCEFNNLISDAGFQKSLANLAYYNINKYYGKAQGNKFGLSFVTGDATTLSKYDPDEFYSVVVRYPEAKNEDLYGNLFGICPNTQTLSRAVEIVTFLNTNSEVRNLLQYGLENINYTVNDEGKISRLNHSYMMDIEKTGNMFLAYPDVEDGYDINAWDAAKKQNQEALLNARLGFTFAENMPGEIPLDTDKIKIVNGYSDTVLRELKACTSMDEVNEKISTWSSKYSAADVNVKYMINDGITMKAADKKVWPYYVYFTWAKTYKYLTPEMQAKIDAQEKEAQESKE